MESLGIMVNLAEMSLLRESQGWEEGENASYPGRPDIGAMPWEYAGWGRTGPGIITHLQGLKASKYGYFGS